MIGRVLSNKSDEPDWPSIVIAVTTIWRSRSGNGAFKNDYLLRVLKNKG